MFREALGGPVRLRVVEAVLYSLFGGIIMTVNRIHSVRRCGIALALAGVLAGSVAVAQDATPGAHPERGDRMPAVEQHFGAPATRYPAVGQPPITRWDYPGMVVYFEGDRVIHTVLVNPSA